MQTNKVTRLEIIDHTPCKSCTPSARILCGACGGTGIRGRQVIFWDEGKQIELSFQDDDRTLKIFINERAEKHEHDSFCLNYGKCSE